MKCSPQTIRPLISAQGYVLSRLPWLWATFAGAMALPLLLPLLSGGVLGWVADLAIHWQWQYAALALLSALIYLVLRRSRLAASMLLATMALAGLNFAWLSLGRLDEGRSDRDVMVASFNLNLENSQASGLEDWVAANRPDVLALFEVAPEHAALLERLQKTLPHIVKQAQGDQFGLAILSRSALHGAQLKDHKGSTPFIDASMNTRGTSVLLRAIHPMPPLSPADQQVRDELILEAARGQDGPLLIMGDFNASPWSLSMRSLHAKGMARATTLEPTHTLYGGLPIDHILASAAHWRVTAAGVAGAFGSDHKLVWAKLARK